MKESQSAQQANLRHERPVCSKIANTFVDPRRENAAFYELDLRLNVVKLGAGHKLEDLGIQGTIFMFMAPLFPVANA